MKRAAQLDKLCKKEMTTQTFPLLTVEFINNNIGKEITWHAYGYHANLPYKGVCKLMGLQESKDINPADNKPYVRPVVEHIKGDDLSFAWVEYGSQITYSDSDTPVCIGSAFDLYTAKWDAESLGCTRANGNPISRSFVVFPGTDPMEKARTQTTATEFDIEHIV